ncbi:uncharacterized protein LOC132053492 isoform X2 [Lycium ferocissimum]|uniref:uncharacterized protein LOC132053492 isoform X2 n=1 Tax=Lycium ferocissimum TaxID=112874 RepID=UPI0028162CE5|nr:uncharacterized protein LOC132053492 isoform X2 [Lycium ferocissimum]
MWAAPPLKQWYPCIPVMTCLPVGAPRKFQLYSQLRNLDLGSVAEQKQQTTKKSQPKYRKQQGAKEEVEEKQEDSKKLSGFDVLRALEKATAQKMKKKRNGKDSSLLSRKVNGKGRNGREEDEDLVNYGNKNVRPLSVKEDWGSRLDDLEKRLQELVDTTTA